MKEGEHDHGCPTCGRTWIVGICEHGNCTTDCSTIFGRHLDDAKIAFADLEVRGDAARGYSLWATFNPRTAREIDVKVADFVHPELIRFLSLNLPKAQS